MSRILRAASILLAVTFTIVSCHHLDDDRIPPVAVRVPFNTVGDWNLYGVAGAGQYRYFIKSEKQPVGYPYTALSYTGFGGILLVSDIHGNPVAYDLACPVECKSDIRVSVITDQMIAECPVCHSTYDIVTNYGHPLSGKAAERGYGLRRYLVVGGPQGEYMVITR